MFVFFFCMFCFLFFVFCVLVLFCVLFLPVCVVVYFLSVYSCTLPLGANPIAVNKYHIILKWLTVIYQSL